MNNNTSSKANNESFKVFMDTDWNTNRPRILLFADIMGFKEIVSTNSQLELVSKFRKFINELTKLMEPLEIGKHLRLTMFSDSIIMGTDSCTIQNFNIIIKAAALLINLCYKYQLPINGCISCGNLTFDEQIQTAEQASENKRKRKIQPYMPLFIGDSVVNAHSLNAELFCYGIVLHPSAEKLLAASNKHSNIKYHHPFYYLPIPMKSGGFAHLYYLSWTKVPTQAQSSTIANYVTWLNNLETEKSYRPRAYIYHTKQIFNQLEE